MTTKRIIEFYEEADRIRFRSTGTVEVTPEMLACASHPVDHHYTNAKGCIVACPPSLVGLVNTFEVPNVNFHILWDRHADELGVPRGTVIR